MKLPTWQDLIAHHCSIKTIHQPVLKSNPHFEESSTRRYNFATSLDSSSCRLVFLNGVLDNPDNKTLRRNGSFIWCKNLRYEGRNKFGMRQISFTVDKGKKRFLVSENNVLCVPSKSYVNNNRYFRTKEKTFKAFSSVFAYNNTLNMMRKKSRLQQGEFDELIKRANPYKPGTLVAPRLGYFHPQSKNIAEAKTKFILNDEHPCGIILGPCHDNTDYSGREFYRVRFGDTTYERVHPVEMEIINEV